jgi:hypothetical protein
MDNSQFTVVQFKKDAKAAQKLQKASENKDRLAVLAKIPEHRAISYENEGRKVMVECNFKAASPVCIVGTGGAGNSQRASPLPHFKHLQVFLLTIPADTNLLIALNEYRTLATELRVAIVFRAPADENPILRSRQDSYIRQLAEITNSFENLKTFNVGIKVQTNIEDSWPQVKSAAHFYGNNFGAWDLWVGYMGEETARDGKAVWKQAIAGGKLDRRLSGWKRTLEKRSR